MTTEHDDLYVMTFEGLPLKLDAVHSIYLCDAADEEDVPVTDDDGKILFFESVSNAERILEFAIDRFRDCRLAPLDRGLVLDLEWVLEALTSGLVDSDARCLNFINTIRDYHAVTKFRVQESHGEALRDLCMHLTFNNKLDQFFQTYSSSRNDVIEALLAHVEGVIAGSRVITNEEVIQTDA